MTKEETIEAWENGRPVVNADPLNGDILYLRIAALIYRKATTEQVLRGYPEKYMQVELEPMNGANSCTVTIPSALRLPTTEELMNPKSYERRAV